MSNPSSALSTAIFTVLSGNVTISGVSFPVYENVEKGAPNRSYVHISTYTDVEQGTKDNYGYSGTIAVEAVDESQANNAKMSRARAISNKTRDLLCAVRGLTFAVTGFTLVIFRLTGSTETREVMKDNREMIKVIDIYEFLIY
jgi:YbbR domain-containing protein